MRKLLPYEYQLIQQLGISKEEYLEFIAVQAAYDDPKQGTVFDTRAELATVSIVLTVVGILFQVASVLLAPKLKAPSTAVAAPAAGEPQTREQRFSPRFGFSGQQDLAKYGDPVNLIYCNTDINPKGAVRAAASLVWSAVRSYGSSQFVQLLMVLGAGRIANINADKSAFGQVALEDLVAQNKFFYHNNQSTGLLTWNDEDYGRASEDPTFYGTVLDNPYRIQPSAKDEREDGFSQAYSPGTQNAFGVYGVVPINVKIYQRDEQGFKQEFPLGITSSLQWVSGNEILRGASVTITIPQNLAVVTTAAQSDYNFYIEKETGIKLPTLDNISRQAQETSRTLASVFDTAGIFKLGSAVFKVVDLNRNSPDEGDMLVTLQCVERGFAPSAAYALGSNVTIDQFTTIENMLVAEGRVQQLTAYRAALKFIEQFNELEKTKQKVPQSLREMIVPSVVIITALQNELNQKQSNTAAAQGTQLILSKALVKVETASYRTIQQCSIVDFAIKSRVFKRITGRQQQYGSANVKGYPSSDNGVKRRTSMFLFQYRKSGQSSFTTAPFILAISNRADIDDFNYFKFISANDSLEYWEFKLIGIYDSLAEIRLYSNPLLKADGSTDFFYLELSPTPTTVNLSDGNKFIASGRLLNSSRGYPILNEAVMGTNEWDMFNLDADSQTQFSFDSGPEFVLACVSEQQQVQSFKNDFPNLYKNLSMVGLNLYSGRNLQDLRSFTAFVKKGRDSKSLRTRLVYGESWTDNNFIGDDAPTCYAADIFLDTVLDVNDGIGKYAKVEGIDMRKLALAKQFCMVNKLFMDGVIADITSWRQFWVEVAPFSLLEFARIGGKETLIPAVPYDENTGEMNRKVNVSALFNQGNILESSYKEEHLDYGSNVQDLIATIVYRGADINGTFSVNRAVEIKLANTLEADSIRQTFNTAQFVSTKEQAVLYGKFLCNIRRHIKVAIEFKTFPTMDPISPGAFVYVDIGQNSWDGIRTGIIGPGGTLNIPLDNSLLDGSYEFLLYQSGKGVMSRTAATSGNTAATLADLEGYLFVLGQKTTTRRVFRVTEVEMDEEGEITVRATNYPCTSDGLSEIANFDDGIFTVTGALD